jgi:thioredoxin reductase
LYKAKVTGARRTDGGFAVTLENGEVIESRMLLLATGVVDELPQIDGFRRLYGKSAHTCPLCDGWEHRGEGLVVTGGDQAAAELAVEMLQWSKDVVLCANGPLKCDDKTRRQLDRGGIRVIEVPIARLEGEGDALAGVRFTDGSFIARTVLFFSPGQHQKSPLAEQLGCEFCDQDGCIQCDEKAGTCVAGVYAAGNASRGVQMVIAAAAEGTLAAVAINNALVEADAENGDL